jgi:hypothetical protein
MTTAQNNIGAVPQNVKRTKLTGGGEWAETPYFGPGLEEDSEHMVAMPVGNVLAGVLRAIRETKAEKPSDRKKYLCLEDFSGNKFRIAAPGQLVYLAEQAGVGSRIAVTYRGKEEVEGYKQPLHQFDVEILEDMQ